MVYRVAGISPAAVATVAALVVASVVAGALTGASSADASEPQPTSITLTVERELSAASESLASIAGPTMTALSGSSFEPGNIISDHLFYDKNAMTQAQIQAFLDAKIGTCSNGNCLNIKRVTTTTRPADRTMCAEYLGAANELASAIIYKVQQSCGISAKVLLVTLQKEQSLVTAKAPSDGTLQRAMGYGCPDNTNGACDANYYGLYNQLYKAAWQFKRYSYPPDPFGNVQLGTEYIQYHPNASCGTKRVYVTNNATAALYNYTPYTPNAAALANLGSTGDACSSYGNRNFWMFYTNWFGNTLADQGNAAIAAMHLKLGGASGALGRAGTAPNCGTSTRCSQQFEHGIVYWTLAGGAIAVSGAMGDLYLEKGGLASSLGIPVGAVTAIVGPNGDGLSQAFKAGQLLSSADGVFALAGTIWAKHVQTG